MTVRGVEHGVSGAVEVLRRRARKSGLATWRCDCAGRILSEPDDAGPIGMLMRSGPVSRLVSEAVRSWERGTDAASSGGASATAAAAGAAGGLAGTDDASGAGEALPNLMVVAEAGAEATPMHSGPLVAHPFPGCWLIGLEERARRERVGYTVVLALGREALGDEWFMAGCVSAQIDGEATRQSLRESAGFDAASVGALARLLGAMLEDLGRADEDQETIAGFTRQLTDGFEVIDLLYALGRSMHDIARPREFVELVAERLHSSMAFGWLAATWRNDAKASSLVGVDTLVRGASIAGEGALRELLPRLLAKQSGRLKPAVLSTLEGSALPGASQVLVQPIVRGGKLAGILALGEKGGEDPQVSSYDIHLLEAAAGYIGAFLDNAVLYADQQAMFMGTLRAMTAAIDAKDRYTRGHSERVALLSKQLALAVGLGADVAERLHICGIVHDVGKIGVPERVLGKPGKLSDEEFAHIKLHPEIGHTILRDIPLLEDILPGVMHHHERYDGKGYPAGLVGEAIPLYARIIALADTFDAMSSTRSYRSAMPREKVLAEFERCAGAQFDPALAKAFLTIDLAEYDAMVAAHRAANVPEHQPDAGDQASSPAS